LGRIKRNSRKRKHGSIFVEYIIVLTLVTLSAGIAVASLGLSLLVNFRFAQGFLTVPFP
jgi:hypothetical protein